jgi:hypothetical protein
MSRIIGRFAMVLRARGGPHWALAGRFPRQRSCHRLRLPSLQVVGRSGESKQPSGFLPAPQLHFSEHPDHLHPAENFLNAFPLLLTDRVASVVRGSRVDGARTVRVVLRHRRRGAARPDLLHPLLGVVVLVGAHGVAPRPRARLDHPGRSFRSGWSCGTRCSGER